MNLLEDLMQLAEDHDIYIHPYPVAGTLAMAFQIGCESAIAIDLERLETVSSQAVTLAHEIGHIETGSLNTLYDRFTPPGRYEYQAWRWAIRRLLPRTKLMRAIVDDGGRLWEVAEDLGVTEALIERAIEYYESKGQSLRMTA